VRAGTPDLLLSSLAPLHVHEDVGESSIEQQNLGSLLVYTRHLCRMAIPHRRVGEWNYEQIEQWGKGLQRQNVIEKHSLRQQLPSHSFPPFV